MRRLVIFLLLLVSIAGVRAQSESMPEQKLRQIVERQKALFAEAAKQGNRLDQEAFRTQAQSIATDYDRLLASNDKFAAGYAAYGYFLGKVGMDKESIGMLLKANQLDPDIPLVKNQIGDYLAEHGKPIQAAEYFLAAIKLAPDEPLYHYQLGTLLSEGRDTFLKSGEWTQAAIDHTIQKAFKRASELRPGDFAYAYRYAESFYEVADPDWNAAMQAWRALEAKAQSPIERQTMQLHEANVYLKMGQPENARTLLAKVDDPRLQVQKQRLVVELDAPKDAAPPAQPAAATSAPAKPGPAKPAPGK